ncbi:MAG: 5-formyltetrahydrofolate cyclo-ligase [Oscillospiraceae bacterium]|nr:5-formyltetrahydrofolate cyclo-ligase [Oscillospiraceae bacterium]
MNRAGRIRCRGGLPMQNRQPESFIAVSEALNFTAHAQYRKWLRKSRIRARDALSPEERAEKSARTVERITQSEAFQKAKTVLIYAHVRAELSLEQLVSHPMSAEKRFAYPLCISDSEMAAMIPSGSGARRPGAFGIPEPVPELSLPVMPEELDLVICPCAAFDCPCNRMGMGAGYYDRYLPKCVNAVICAVAFEAQKAERVPAEEWDRPMDMVFTEKEVYVREKKADRL